MSTKTDKAMDLLPTLRAALVALDDALDNLDETDSTVPEAVEFAKGDVIAAEDDVLRILGQIEDSIDSILA